MTGVFKPLILFFFSVVEAQLPTSGKFFIGKYSDNTCKKPTDVSLNEPRGPCWSSAYNNGIKPTGYNSTTKVLTFNTYLISSCFGTPNQASKKITCDGGDCTKLSDNEYLKCNYISYPTQANFTFNKYSDENCKQESGVAVFMGNSACWNIEENLSFSPFSFSLSNLKNLSLTRYGGKDCKVESNGEEQIKCDGKCFTLGGSTNKRYKCFYIGSSYLSYTFLLLILLLIVF